MLFEALHYACARLGGEPNPHGHLTELVGIWARHRRQRQAWAGHLARARGLCLAAAEATSPQKRRTALVYGGGILNDVPLEQLAVLFRRVILADMAFLPSTVRLAKALGTVSLLHADLTGVLHAAPPAQAADVPVPDLALGQAEVDFAYSANVLSQLPLAPLAVMARQSPDAALEPRQAYGAALVCAHLEALAALPCPACLVTDTTERGLSGGVAQYEDDLLHGVRPGLTGENWIWRLAPRGEAHPELDIERQVLGVRDVHAARPDANGGRHV